MPTVYEDDIAQKEKKIFEAYKEKLIEGIGQEHKSLFGFDLQDALVDEIRKTKDHKELCVQLALQISSFADKCRTYRK